MDITAEAKWKGKIFRFYIQCKHHNRPIGKTPIQEIFAGTAFHQDYGGPVVITNNEATFTCSRKPSQTVPTTSRIMTQSKIAHWTLTPRESSLWLFDGQIRNGTIIQKWVVVLFLYTGKVAVWYYGIEKYLKKVVRFLKVRSFIGERRW